MKNHYYSTVLRLFVIFSLMAAFTSSGAAALQPEARISDPTVTLTYPPYYLNQPTTSDAPYSYVSPLVNGEIQHGEYARASKITFPTYKGMAEAYITQDAANLYIAFDSLDTAMTGGGGPGPAFQVFIDSQHNHGSLPQTDDFLLTITKSGALSEAQGDGTGWSSTAIAKWSAAARLTSWGWQAEFSIQLNKFIYAPTSTFGLALAEVWTPSWPKDWYWPAGAHYMDPSSWGTLMSSSSWSTFYWKPGPWQDYAPSGVPDFDQRVMPYWGIGPTWTYCGPVAVANSLWWFDSKFETLPGSPPGITDTYRLVQSYNPTWDDHDPNTVINFVDDLANNYFMTNVGQPGTNILSMFNGLQAYLKAHSLWDDYTTTLVPRPSFGWVADEVNRSEDVVLLLGFYETGAAAPKRVGGHYVTVAGVDPNNKLIAFSDPIIDRFELYGGAGRSLDGILIPHTPKPGHPPFVHLDAGNVSHDIYLAVDTQTPGGIWGPEAYPWTEVLPSILGVNPHPEIPTEPYTGGAIEVEVEYALAVSPFRWKSSGYWDNASSAWQPWIDYAPSGMPDFDQKQDSWSSPFAVKWTFCGPAAAANSLWWFDSKFETKPVQPPGFSNQYGLINSYASMLPLWDDHDPLNVDSAATPWPPGGEFVEDLATHFQTNAVGAGTIITDVYTGLYSYLHLHEYDFEYNVKKVKKPEFWWIARQVEHSHDVILLLGFWAQDPTGLWYRIGGHYVNVAGVDRQGGYISFSDPWFNRIEASWPIAGLIQAGWPWYTGRVANGSLTPHIHPGGTPDTIHNDAGNVSHDIYRVGASSRVPLMWIPAQYVTSPTEITNFEYQNGGGSGYVGGTVYAEVEWAIVVSPHSLVRLPLIYRPITP
ncbi:MAG: hypothetical protein JXB15_00630 [Anaerolineales bacterium]|nr:hypothetical protein [Anaerolineales bacterium]